MGLRATVDRSPSAVDVLEFAVHRGLTVYDATYLELAQREGAPLATLDAAVATDAAAYMDLKLAIVSAQAFIEIVQACRIRQWIVPGVQP
jgi:hypothetical protein